MSDREIGAVSAQAAGEARAPGIVIERGTCRVFLAFDVAHAIDLGEARRRLTASSQEENIRRTRPAPRHFEFHPPPLRTPWRTAEVEVAGRKSGSTAEATVWDFGAICVTFVFPIEGTLDSLTAFGEALYENAALQAEGRRAALAMLEAIGPAAQRAQVAEAVEDYAVFTAERWSLPGGAGAVSEGLERESGAAARLLRAERGELSAQQTREALSASASYSPGDALLVDWNAAVLFDERPGDALAVLEYANLELLELRVLDTRLDDALDEAHRAASRVVRGRLFRGVGREELRRVARLQVEGALLFEGVNNAIKLVGDQHLARVYRLASERMHLAEWDASVLRKLSALESVYEKMSDELANRRMEFLEWIIILLIAFEVVMGLIDRLL